MSPGLEFRRVLSRSQLRPPLLRLSARAAKTRPRHRELDRARRSEERRVGKSVDLGGRRIIKKKKEDIRDVAGTGVQTCALPLPAAPATPAALRSRREDAPAAP